jgi:hypothetical protein
MMEAGMDTEALGGIERDLEAFTEFEIRCTDLDGHLLASELISVEGGILTTEQARALAKAFAKLMAASIPNTRISVWGKKKRNASTAHWTEYEITNRDGDLTDPWLGASYLPEITEGLPADPGSRRRRMERPIKTQKLTSGRPAPAPMRDDPSRFINPAKALESE